MKFVARYFWDSLRTEWALAVFLTIATSSAYIRAADATTAASVILHASTCLLGVVASAVTWRSAVSNEINRKGKP